MTPTLDSIYARIPSMHCKGLCVESCHSIGLHPAEAARIEERHGLTITTGYHPDGCAALVDGRCSIYDDRPLVCRLWGVVPSMPCPHGCVPVVALTEDAARALMASAGGPAT